MVAESDPSNILDSEELDLRKALNQPHDPDSGIDSSSVCANYMKKG